MEELFPGVTELERGLERRVRLSDRMFYNLMVTIRLWVRKDGMDVDARGRPFRIPLAEVFSHMEHTHYLPYHIDAMMVRNERVHMTFLVYSAGSVLHMGEPVERNVRRALDELVEALNEALQKARGVVGDMRCGIERFVVHNRMYNMRAPVKISLDRIDRVAHERGWNGFTMRVNGFPALCVHPLVDAKLEDEEEEDGGRRKKKVCKTIINIFGTGSVNFGVVITEQAARVLQRFAEVLLSLGACWSEPARPRKPRKPKRVGIRQEQNWRKWERIGFEYGAFDLLSIAPECKELHRALKMLARRKIRLEHDLAPVYKLLAAREKGRGRKRRRGGSATAQYRRRLLLRMDEGGDEEEPDETDYDALTPEELQLLITSSTLPPP